jgi:hypothetical protein
VDEVVDYAYSENEAVAILSRSEPPFPTAPYMVTYFDARMGGFFGSTYDLTFLDALKLFQEKVERGY